jgi:hypothetical protein
VVVVGVFWGRKDGLCVVAVVVGVAVVFTAAGVRSDM